MAQTSTEPQEMFFRRTMRQSEYDFDVLPRPGKDNGDTDGLYRFEDFQIHEGITKTEEAKLKRNNNTYRCVGNSMLVLHRGERFLNPSPKDRPVLIKQYYERAHQGASTVLKNLKLRYFWPKMEVEVAEQVASCPCARENSRVPQKTMIRFPTLP